LFLAFAVNPSISQWVSTGLMADTVILDYCRVSDHIHISTSLSQIDG
jgi:hypothetical protein